jgi:hypothetical protein
MPFLTYGCEIKGHVILTDLREARGGKQGNVFARFATLELMGVTMQAVLKDEEQFRALTLLIGRSLFIEAKFGKPGFGKTEPSVQLLTFKPVTEKEVS